MGMAMLLLLLTPWLASPALSQETASASGIEDRLAGYHLSPLDQVLVDVIDHPELSGSYTLDSSGRITLPLIGDVEAAGLTAEELSRELVGQLRPDYLVNPRVQVSVQYFRPYYLMGEVSGTGAFPFQEGMTYLEAIAKAGGYSYRARQGVVYVIRAGTTTRDEIKLDVNEKVQPGDIVRVAERLF
jgi:polysaccharide export outer membrane protein